MPQPSLRAQLNLLHARDESGQVFVFLVLALITLAGMSAFVIDLGRAYNADRQLQASADAAALSGAHELPDPLLAVAVAEQYSGSAGAKNEQANLPGVSTLASAECRSEGPCNPVNAVVVEQEATIETFFAKVLGMETITVHARAVAFARAGEVPYAIFSNDSDCGGFSFTANASAWQVEGAVRSNGDFVANGENISAGWASAHGEPCLADVGGTNIDFGGASEPEYDPEPEPWPVWYEVSDFACDYTANKFEFNENNITIPAGVYCATEAFIANGNFQTGNITVLAPEISINGQWQTFTPYANGVLFFSTGSKDMVLNGNGYDWTGTVFHPGGRVKINGDENSVLTGLIEGREVEINGNVFNMFGTGPLTGRKLIQLVE